MMNLNKKVVSALVFLVFLISLLSLTANSLPSDYPYPFNVSLKYNLIESGSNDITIEPIELSDGSGSPLVFGFNIHYNITDNLNCTFSILYSDFTSVNTQDLKQKISLSNGNHTWILNCLDSQNSSVKEKNKISSFTTNEHFTTSLSKEVYLLDGGGNLIGGTGTFQASSAKNSDINIKIHKPSSSSNWDFFGTTSSPLITLGEDKINETGTYKVNTTFYRLAFPVSIEDEFYVAKAELDFEEDVKSGEEIDIHVKINSPVKNIEWYTLDFGDGSEPSFFSANNDNSINRTHHHTYDEEGSYTITLKVHMNKTTFTISKNGVSVGHSEDNEEPTVSMLYPSDNAELSQDSITFRYKAEDDVKIKNCTFELYNYSNGVGTLDYSKVSEDLANNEEVSIALTKFNEGEYSWNVYCCDNSSNCNDDLEYYQEFALFLNATVSATSEDTDYAQKEEVQELISKLNEFVAKKDSYTAEEKEILDDLEISDNIEFYRKRLNQIDQDLGHNLKFIEDESQRQKREDELVNEIREIREGIPVDMKIIESKEFVKNSLTKDMESIILEYFNAKGIKTEKLVVSKLAELNVKAQNYLVVSTDVKQVQIDYIDYIKELTLVTKSVDLKNNTFSTLLEVIPKEVAENASDVTFITPATTIKEDPIFEVSVDDLENEKLVYYINKPVSTDKIKETDTLIFKEFAVNNLITGFFILDLEMGNWIYYIIVLFLIVVIGVMLWYYLRNRKMREWKREENVVRVLKCIRDANSSLERRDIESAKGDYHKIRELFPLIPGGCRKVLNKRVDKIRVEIDKKEIFSLLKEFEVAKKEQRMGDAEIIYKKLQLIYKRLPKKYQQRVLERLKL